VRVYYRDLRFARRTRTHRLERCHIRVITRRARFTRRVRPDGGRLRHVFVFTENSSRFFRVLRATIFDEISSGACSNTNVRAALREAPWSGGQRLKSPAKQTVAAVYREQMFTVERT